MPLKSTFQHRGKALKYMDSEDEKLLDKKRIELLFNQFPFSIAIACIFAVLVAFKYWDQSNRYVLSAWLAGYLLVSALHYLLVLQYAASVKEPDKGEDRNWLNDFILFVFLSGVLWGLIGLYFLINNPAVHSYTVFIFLGGMVAASIGVFAAMPSVFFAFALPALMPVLAWLPFQDQSLINSIGLFMLLFLIFLSISILKLRNLIVDSMSIDLKNRERLRSLEKERTEASTLNDTLEEELRKIKDNDLQLKREKRKAEELAAKLLAISTMDGLTGISNRRYFDEFLAKEWNRAIRSGAPLSLILCDIDYFKNFNDCYGHQEGDKCLQRIAGLLEEHARRGGDLAARYGGEEFGIVLPETNLESARDIAEQMRIAVENIAIPHEASAINNIITISFGVATIIPQRDQESRLLVSLADKALYKAKKEGRNRVIPLIPELYPEQQDHG